MPIAMILTLAFTTAALGAAPGVSSGAVVQAYARATIVRGVTAAPPSAVSPRIPFTTRRVRPCDGLPACRLIVTDLP